MDDAVDGARRGGLGCLRLVTPFLRLSMLDVVDDDCDSPVPDTIVLRPEWMVPSLNMLDAELVPAVPR